jgi:hypothetical protein
MTLKVFGVIYIKSKATLLSGASIIRTAQAESQLRPPDRGAIPANLTDIPPPLVGPILLDLKKGKAKEKEEAKGKAEAKVTVKETERRKGPQWL